MHKGFYLRFAASNIKRNKMVYIPYLLASSIIIMIFYLFLVIGNNPGMNNLPSSVTLTIILNIGVVIGAIFAVIFVLYANSFLIKRRKKEFGLYSILGLARRHIARIMMYESIIASVIALVVGIGVGTAFGKVFFLILMKMIHVSEGSSLIITPSSVMITVVVFLVIFCVSLLINIMQVQMSRPVELMSSENKGEKQPKSSWIVALIGAISLGAGYVMAQCITLASLNFASLLLPVIFVIIGTYLLFMAGSIKVLTILKKRKNYYTKPERFISVSGLMYRMKQNAVGLASICIICTMVIVTMIVTTNIQFGAEATVSEYFRYDLEVSYIPNKEYKKLLEESLVELSEKHDLKITRNDIYADKSITVFVTDDYLDVGDANNEQYYEDDSFVYIQLLTLEEFNRLTGENITLEPNHAVAAYSAGGEASVKNYLESHDNIHIKGSYTNNADEFGNYEVQSVDETLVLDNCFTDLEFTKAKYADNSNIYLVVPDEETIESLCSINAYDRERYTLHADFEGSESNKAAMVTELEQKLYDTGYGSSFNSIDQNREAFYMAYGGLIFIGIMISVVFLVVMVIIIYYKQLVEGYEDRDKYQIMIKVGIDEADVKKTIRTQMKIIFLLPIVTAIIHSVAAYKFSRTLVAMAIPINEALMIGCTIGVAVFVTIIYLIVYRITAKVYYSIIR